jgi:hypothetical protein
MKYGDKSRHVYVLIHYAVVFFECTWLDKEMQRKHIKLGGGNSE